MNSSAIAIDLKSIEMISLEHVNLCIPSCVITVPDKAFYHRSLKEAYSETKQFGLYMSTTFTDLYEIWRAGFSKGCSKTHCSRESNKLNQSKKQTKETVDCQLQKCEKLSSGLAEDIS